MISKYYSILFLICTITVSDKNPILFEDYRLYGDVKSMTTISYKLNPEVYNDEDCLCGPEEVNLKPTERTEKERDSIVFKYNGNYIEKIENYNNGWLSYETLFKYSGSLLIEKTNITFSGTEDFPNEIYRTEYEYNPKNILTTTLNYFQDSLNSKVLFKNNLIQEKFIFDNQSSISEKLNYKYNNLNQLIEKSAYDKTGKLLYSIKNNYINSRDYSNEWYTSKNELDTKTTIEYDEEGNYTEKIFYVENGELLLDHSTKYNKNDDIIMSIFSSVNPTEYTYKYDKNGNWIERIEYLNNSPIEETVRIIEYKK
ncbi:hypothetical protein [Aureivirga sp. CE67]|uniref:hypothetical protein n=1 Tax=Aureivirga sp. CE67 TaxID=1788983 RepID=UPI0018CA4C37|nr:hypothetical protein [Aureivirga sp. CE67]